MPRRNNDDRLQTRWMMSLRRLGGPPLLLASAAPLAAGALLLLQAYLLATLLHGAIVQRQSTAHLLPLLACIGAVLCARAALTYAGEISASIAAERIKSHVRDALFSRLVRESSDQLARRRSGGLAAALVDQVEALDGFFVRFFPAMVQAAILPIAFAIVLFPVDWVVGALFLVTAPLIPIFMALVGWGAEAANSAQAEAFTRLSARFADRLRGIVTLKLFGQAEREVTQMRLAGEELRARTLVVLRIAFLSSAVLEFFAALGVAGVALYVGLSYLHLIDVRATPMTLQAGLFCLLMAPEVYQPLRLLSAHYHDRARAKAAVAEIAKAFCGLPSTIAVPCPTRQSSAEPHPALPLVLRGVSVYTPDQTRLVAGPLDLELAAGDRIALLGESGVGKSTLIEAIGGLRDHFGEVLLGGEPIVEMPEVLLRDHIAFLGQRPRIFAGSIADNIRLGRGDCSAAELREAATRACVCDFANTLPDGLATLLGEDGIGLSGGEAHRVALARLYLRHPSLVLLDEPTAHLDAAAEARVLDGLLDFTKDRTLLVTTHSLAVAERMQRAYRLVEGRLLRTPHRGRRSASRLEVVA